MVHLCLYVTFETLSFQIHSSLDLKGVEEEHLYTDYIGIDLAMTLKVLVVDFYYHMSASVQDHHKSVDFHHSFFVHLGLSAGYIHPVVAVVHILPVVDHILVGQNSHHAAGHNPLSAVHNFLAGHNHLAGHNSLVYNLAAGYLLAPLE